MMLGLCKFCYASPGSFVEVSLLKVISYCLVMVGSILQPSISVKLPPYSFSSIVFDWNLLDVVLLTNGNGRSFEILMLCEP